MTDEEKFMTDYRWKGPMTLARKIENVFSFLYSEPAGNLCHFDKDLLDEIKAAALRGCAAVPEGLAWVPVSVTPPLCETGRFQNDKPYVLAIDTKNRMSVGYCWKASKGEICWTFAKAIGEVTHWMPLPPPPSMNNSTSKE